VTDFAGRVSSRTPEDVLLALSQTISDRYTGVEALGLAAPIGHIPRVAMADLARLPAPPGPAGLSEDERRQALVNLWLREAVRAGMLKLPQTPPEWLDSREGGRVRRGKGSFSEPLKAILGSSFYNANLTRTGGRARPWLAWLEQHMGQDATANGFFLRPNVVKLDLSGGLGWRRCGVCTTVQPVSPLAQTCVSCGGSSLAPLEACREVVEARTDYFRRSYDRALNEPSYAPHPFVAEEHTAQLNQAMEGEIFSRTERYELRFQDVDVMEEKKRQGPIDVLSCTTTMEVGIDIGSLTGVALRNVPPGRANYQQRAGRAGRRGSSLATVITFAGADSHDQRFFNDPAGMVSGPVRDPTLNLRNREIVRRHIFALLLGLFQLERISDDHGDAEGASNLFMSLGSLESFRRGAGEFSYRGLERWLGERRVALRAAIIDVLPDEMLDTIDGDPGEVLARELLEELTRAGAGPVDGEGAVKEPEPAASVQEEQSGWLPDDDAVLDDLQGRQEQATDVERGDTGTSEEEPLSEDLLLDRLFAKAVLPRYAFPTDVVSFHVFDDEASTPFAVRLRYGPQQGLTAALSQYAPGREVWVDGRRWYSMAIWEPSPGGRDRWRAYRRQQLYFECRSCGFALLESPSGEWHVGVTRDCPACARPAGMGPALRWFTPPGFAHPIDIKERLPDGSAPPSTRPTRAKLRAPSISSGAPVLDQRSPNGVSGVTVWVSKEDLLVTNVGNAGQCGKEGFLYCLHCGRAEPNGWSDGLLQSGQPHPKPAPRWRPSDPTTCNGRVLPVTLGHVFRTDISLFRFTLGDGVRLDPSQDTAKIAMRTLAEAMALAAADLLQLDPGELAGEWRAAQTEAGKDGREVEVYLYDQVPGGAGYARMAALEQDPTLLEHTLTLLTECLPKDCDTSCYQCLRSYNNRWMHGDLDRHLAAALLRHCIEGKRPALDREGVAQRLHLVASHLRDDDVDVEQREDHLLLPKHAGRQVYVAHPLLPRAPFTLAEPSGDFVVLNQLQVDRALPSACLLALHGDSDRPEDPFAGLTRADEGVPVYRLSDLAGGWQRGPAPVAWTSVPGAPEGAFVVRLESDAMELERYKDRPLRRGTWLLCERHSGEENLDRRGLEALPMRIFLKRGGAFQATKEPWTVGRGRFIQLAGTPRILVKYNTVRVDGAPEQVQQDVISSLGVVVRPIGV
jgi:hypothetical protein